MPDVDFLVNLGDYPLAKKNERRYSPQVPIFSWCGSDDSLDIVMPTYELTEASVHMMRRVAVDVFSVQVGSLPDRDGARRNMRGSRPAARGCSGSFGARSWLVQLRAAPRGAIGLSECFETCSTNSYSSIPLAFKDRASQPFSERQFKAFWRGRDSREERLRLVELSQREPQLLNASITNFFFYRDKMEKYGGGSPHVSFFDFFEVRRDAARGGSFFLYFFICSLPFRSHFKRTNERMS